MAVSVVTLVRLFLSVVALALVSMAWMAWNRRKRAPEGPILCLLALSAAFYCFGYAQEVAQATLPQALFWLHVEYVGIPWLPALWMWLVRKHLALPTRFGLLFVIPVVTFVGELTNSYHHLYDYSFQLVSRPPFQVVSADRGPLAWLGLAYIYGALCYGSWLYVTGSRRTSKFLRKQGRIFVSAGLLPLAGYLVYLCGKSPWGLDLAPATMAGSAILGYFALVELQCFDLVPMARSLVFNSVRDAVLVTDLEHRLVDLNPAAQELLPRLGNLRLGEDVTLVANLSHVLQRAFCDPDYSDQIDLDIGDETKHFEARVLSLCVDERQAGWAVILADITAQVQLLHQLRSDAETDALTGVANRRRFIAAIERETVRFIRHGAVFSLILVDVDRFKTINDRFGHAAGDRVLSAVAERIGACLRCGDLLSRYGGDEFAILLPDTGPEGSFEVAERIRAIVAKDSVAMDGKTFAASVSIGLATLDASHAQDWVQLLAEADRGLYRAKAQGRNRVSNSKRVLSPEPENVSAS